MRQNIDPHRVSRMVYILVYEHRHGQDISAYGSAQERSEAVAEIVRDQWKDRADRAAPDDPAGLTDEEAVAAYFEGHEEEFVTEAEILVDFAAEEPDDGTSDMLKPMSEEIRS